MTVTAANPTLLRLDPIKVPPYSARGITQSLEPVRQASQVRRTTNGALRDISHEQFRQYVSTITCNDMKAPALAGVWPGRVLVVDCIVEHAYRTIGGVPDRGAVPGSENVIGEFTYYRPRLTMMVISYEQNEDEWGAKVGWTLNLEEVNG